ncbi:hypothetical protein [Methanobrevibacter arboriphilus]|uniref:hypothetical protein n=1 Tax=Methanobrevibacter arboriphilus TaxID=39441 RepID=UPI001CDB0161|nr:hypothetical protein [Methanobrevibacter arboriphilus]
MVKKVNDLSLNTLTGKASVLKTKDDVFNRSIKIEDIEQYKNKELEEIKSMKNIESKDGLEKNHYFKYKLVQALG